jgi:hypothetical protein
MPRLLEGRVRTACQAGHSRGKHRHPQGTLTLSTRLHLAFFSKEMLRSHAMHTHHLLDHQDLCIYH